MRERFRVALKHKFKTKHKKKVSKMSTKSETLERSKTIKSLEDLALRKFLKRFLVTVGYETFHKKNEELYDFLEPVRLYLHRTNKFSLAKKWILELMFEKGSWISVNQAKKIGQMVISLNIGFGIILHTSILQNWFFQMY